LEKQFRLGWHLVLKSPLRFGTSNFHADAVSAVDVIVEPFKVGEDRVIVDASDFE
jgi:hypothetical protein